MHKGITKMPLFRSKFQPKKSPARKATSVSNLRRSLDPSQVEQEFGLQVNRIKLDLGYHQQLEFDEQNGRWIYQGKTSKSVKSHDKAEAEANLLKVQVQVLLDMVISFDKYLINFIIKKFYFNQ